MTAKESMIVVVGSANVDLTTFNDVFPRPGETIFGKKFDLGFGGKGANQAVAARLCGASVGMVAKVGSDLFGPATIRNFESQGIDATCVGIAEGVSSGVAPIFVDPSGQNRIIVVKGANDTLSPEDVDPAPAQPVDFEQVAAADYFIPNESEAEVISGMPVTSADEARKCAQFLLQQGMRRVVITLGERGCLVAGPEEVELIPAFKVQAVDTTGAGDAFIGSFAVFLGEGLQEKEALARANLYAALSTTKVGTQKSFLKRLDFEKEWRNRGGRL